MSDLVLRDDLVARLQEIARRENRPLDDVIESLLAHYTSGPVAEANSDNPLEAFIGLFAESDVTDASTTVRETLEEYYREKYGTSD